MGWGGGGAWRGQRPREGDSGSRAQMKLWQPTGTPLLPISHTSLPYLLSSHTGNFCAFLLPPPLTLHETGPSNKDLPRMVLLHKQPHKSHQPRRSVQGAFSSSQETKGQHNPQGCSLNCSLLALQWPWLAPRHVALWVREELE